MGRGDSGARPSPLPRGVGVLVLAACAGGVLGGSAGPLLAQQPLRPPAQPVEVEHAEVDFSGYKSYAWVPSAQRAQTTADDIRLSRAIERELADDGLRLQAEGKPDLLVSYRNSTRKKARTSGYTEDSPWSPNNRRTMFDVSRVNVGKLVITLLDNHTRKVVWQGTLEYEVTTPDMVLDQLDDCVQHVLAQYPPRPEPDENAPQP